MWMWMRYTAVRLANLNFILEGWHGGCKVIVPRFCFVFIQATRKTWKNVTNVPCTKLSGIGPFTVFAPTNDAFRLLGPGITTTLLLGLLVGKRTIETIVDRCWAIVESLSNQCHSPEDPAREHSLLDTGFYRKRALQISRNRAAVWPFFASQQKWVLKSDGMTWIPSRTELALTFVWRCYSITFVMATLWVRIFCRIRTVLWTCDAFSGNCQHFTTRDKRTVVCTFKKLTISHRPDQELSTFQATPATLWKLSIRLVTWNAEN